VSADRQDSTGGVPSRDYAPLFRREAGRLVAALTRVFGMRNLALAEDVVQDAFCKAIERWPVDGVPDNPGAWLATAARHRAIDLVRRDATARTSAPALGHLLDTEWALAPLVDESFDDGVVRDEQLRTMFTCCHPDLPEEVQVALVLNVLCGFGAGELASAFLTGRAAVEKRLSRGKRTLAASDRLFDLDADAFAERLSAVRRALYLLFNEGYHGASARTAVRADLCAEALRLATWLCEHPPSATPTTHALAALMAFQAARLPARTDAAGELHPLGDQDRSRWDAGLLGLALDHFARSAAGTEVSGYHLEAAIAAVHAGAATADEIDWDTIVGLYDRLFARDPSPVVALHRAIAIGQRDGADAGLAALLAIEDPERLHRYPVYPAALADLELRRGDPDAARAHLRVALGLARNDVERRFLRRRLDALA
jgi:predicted RNA polymerase sigma factor